VSGRRFSASEKAALWVAADGRCESCGSPLEPGWHADHRLPWSRGGATDVLNGQALCPACNLQKGNRMAPAPSPWPISLPLRGWQSSALAQVLSRFSAGERDFLTVAAPAAGKTRFAARVAHELLRSGAIERVVVVVPTEPLKTQWARAVTPAGIHLNPRLANAHGQEVAATYHGAVVTYAQVASEAAVHRIGCRRPTLAVFDEIHHAGDERSWGGAAAHAFDGAAYRLQLSGTPFRTDGTSIPFVSGADGRLRIDFAYTYGEAIRDGVCRSVVFPSWEGELNWSSGPQDFDRVAFGDDLPAYERGRRLLAAMEVGGGWLEPYLIEANAHLDLLRRNGDPGAGGLVLARDQRHAAEIQRLLGQITGEQPVLATSDVEGAADLISAFAGSRERWIVAVRMVSEGVDIPRLRLAVFATNTTTDLFFRQAVGRITRWMADGPEEQSAYFYIPRLPELIDLASSIKGMQAETAQALEDLDRAAREPREPGQGRPFVNRGGTAVADDWLLADGVRDAAAVAIDEISRAQAIAAATGLPVPPEQIALIARELERRAGMAAEEADEAATPDPRPAYLIIEGLRQEQDRLVRRYAGATGSDFKDIYDLIARRVGAYRDEATEEHLRQGNELIRELLAERGRGR
jgi:superfamily II DNA or RNA helicase/uncharacterized protein YukE